MTGNFSKHLLLLIVFFVLTDPCHAAWYNSNWTYRLPLTVKSSQVNGDLSNFPVYVDLSHLPDAFFDNVAANGADLRITKADGTTEVAREIVSLNKTTNGGELHFQANGTLSSSSNTVFYLYYGNLAATEPAASSTYGSEKVWDSNFVGVWHFNESPVNGSAMVTDSTSNSNNGSPRGAMNGQDLVAGRVANAYDLDGLDDFINVPNDPSLDFTSAYSLQTWIKVDLHRNYEMIFSRTDTNNDIEVYIRSSDLVVLHNRGNGGSSSLVQSLTRPPIGQWNLLSITLSANTSKFYHNGNELNSAAMANDPLDTDKPWMLGSTGDTGTFGATREVDGIMDEVRFSNIARSANWISAQFNNQNSPSTFYNIGAQETQPQWYDTSWTYRLPIIVHASQINGDLSNFPVYVDLNAFNGTDFFGVVRSDGGDIRITKSDGNGEVAREIVAMDTANGTGEMHFVANGTLSSSFDTTFYLYYGNASATEPAASSTYGSEKVWDSNFVGVWHLGEDGNTSDNGYRDSTSFANHGNGVSMLASSDVAGKVGIAQDYDGSADYISIPDNASINGLSAITVGLWARADVASGVVASKSPTASQGWEFDYNIFYIGTGSWTSAAISPPTSQWYHAAATWNGSVIRAYENAVEENSAAKSGVMNDTGEMTIGKFNRGASFFNGKIDEVRMSNIARSANWISASYNNQNLPVNFLSGLTEEALPLTNWSKSNKITIQSSQVNGDLSNFPVHLDLSDMPGSFFSIVKSDGGDIRVTNGNQMTQLPYELVGLDTANGSGELWFRAGFLSGSTDTEFYIFYGHPGAGPYAANSIYGSQSVWSNGYLAVYHMNEDPNGDPANGTLDSTSSAYHCSPNGTMTTADLVSGKLGKAIDFDGVDDYLDTPDDTSSSVKGVLSFADTENYNFSVWYKGTDTEQNGNHGKALLGRNSGDIWSQFVLRSGKLQFSHYTSVWNLNIVSTTNGADGSWHNFNYTNHSNETGDLYIDAVQEIDGQSSSLSGTKYMTVSSIMLGYLNKHTIGQLDEVHISTKARDANWIKTEYNNQNSPSTFYKISGGGGLFDWQLF